MLSELEGLTLGLLSKHGPCTAYSIRQMLKEAPSSHWRASAGSIYPLLARLEKDRLIEGEDDPADGRARKVLKLSVAGRKKLKSWIKHGSDADLIAQLFDPVRNRIFFMEVLGKQEQLRLAQEILCGMEEHLHFAHQNLKDRDRDADMFDYLGATGAVLACEARIKFMKQVVKELERQS